VLDVIAWVKNEGKAPFYYSPDYVLTVVVLSRDGPKSELDWPMIIGDYPPDVALDVIPPGATRSFYGRWFPEQDLHLRSKRFKAAITFRSCAYAGLKTEAKTIWSASRPARLLIR
jgi:hypothetical protein